VTPPVLCYHRIGGAPELGVTRVARSVFERQMRSLAEAGWRTLTLSEFAAPTTPHAPRTFLLTFDDGYESLAEYAYPVLERFGFTAATFLITDFVGRENRWDMRYTWRRLRHLDWMHIEHWRARGFEFASHGARHRRLTWVDDVTAHDELYRARTVLIGRLGPEAGRAIAYPFGAADARVQRLAQAAGYELGFGGVRGDAALPWHLPRVPVYMWDATNVPFGLRQDSLGAVGRFVAHVANRCAVGTSMLQAVRGRIWRPPGSTVDA
jgi:peptidoglycan/xylan/chitin deacetylase (PgdA/CDA1 family)